MFCRRELTEAKSKCHGQRVDKLDGSRHMAEEEMVGEWLESER